jgi:hypothetical protein
MLLWASKDGHSTPFKQAQSFPQCRKSILDLLSQASLRMRMPETLKEVSNSPEFLKKFRS